MELDDDRSACAAEVLTMLKRLRARTMRERIREALA